MNTYDPKPFQRARALFPHTKNLSYFNSAAYGPLCTPVQKAIEENIALRLAAEKDDTMYCNDVAAKLRADFAWLVGAKADDIGIGLNTSFGLNVAAYGLPLSPGDEVLVSDVDFPAIIYTWKAAAKERGLKLTILPSTDRNFDIDILKKHLSPKSKVLCLSSVQFFNGYKNDLAAISRICKERGIYFVVDGIQGAGMEPINVVDLGIDIFTSGCQKWLLAPQGSGFFYLPSEIRAKLHQPFMSWLGVDWQMNYVDFFRFEQPPYESARRFEMGYYVVFNLLGMKAAMEIFKELGIEAIQQHTHRLIDMLAAYIHTRSDLRITSSLDEKYRSSIFSFTGEHYEKLHKHLLSQKIIQSCREGSIRISVHLFNDETDIERVIRAIESFVPSAVVESMPSAPH